MNQQSEKDSDGDSSDSGPKRGRRFFSTFLSLELRVLSTRGNAPTRRPFWPASRQWWVDVRGSPCAPRDPDQHGNPAEPRQKQ